MCENCQQGVSFIGKTGSKQCIPNENMHWKELPFAASGYVCMILLHSAGAKASPASPCQTNSAMCTYGCESTRCISLEGYWPAFVSPL